MGWTKWYGEELRDLYKNVMIWAGHVARSMCEEKRNPHRVCRENARKYRRWRGDNIEIDTIDSEYEGVECIDLAEDRDKWRAFLNTVMNIFVHKMREIC